MKQWTSAIQDVQGGIGGAITRMKPMLCIFCGEHSISSRSAEHIVPASLGNVDHVLPVGVVCDRCNNYFSREVEKPFLEAPAVRNLRFLFLIESRRGTVPSADALMITSPALAAEGGGEVGLKSVSLLRIDDQGSSQVADGRNSQDPQHGVMFLVTDLRSVPTVIVSRFLAKVAVEAFATRYSQLIYDPQLADIKKHARRGTDKTWPVHVRPLYEPGRHEQTAEGEPFQTLHEFDFLTTAEGEWYFVMVILGTEFAINLGGPEIDGYERWLSQNEGASPLYVGKNASHH